MSMPVQFPSLPVPIDGLTACNVVDITDEPMQMLFQSRRVMISDISVEGVPYWTRLLIDKFDSAKGHFHLELSKSEAIRPQRADCDIATTQDACDRIVGRIVEVRFESKFRLPRTSISKTTFLGAWSNIQLNVGGVQGTLLGGTAAITDSVYKELRWRPYRQDNTQHLAMELLGTLDRTTFSAEIFSLIARRVSDGIARFVTGPQRATQ